MNALNLEHGVSIGTTPLGAVRELEEAFSSVRNAVRKLTQAGHLQNGALKAISTAERRTIRALYAEPK
jgi:hypothetical protein